MKDNQKFCEQDTDEENKQRIKYEEELRANIRCTFSSEKGLFKKKMVNEQDKVCLTPLGENFLVYFFVASNIPYKYIKYYLSMIEKEKPMSEWRTKGRKIFDYLLNNNIKFKFDKEPKINISDESDQSKMHRSIVWFMSTFESIDRRLKENDIIFLYDNNCNLDKEYISRYYNKKGVKGRYIKKYKLCDDYTLFSLILMYLLQLIFYFYLSSEMCMRKEDNKIKIEDLGCIVSVIDENNKGSWAMRDKEDIHIPEPKKDVERQIRQYIINNFFDINNTYQFSFYELPYMKFLIINSDFSRFVDELIKDIAVEIYIDKNCEMKYQERERVIINDNTNYFNKIIRHVYFGDKYNFECEEGFVDNKKNSEKIKIDTLSIFSMLEKKRSAKCSVPKTLRASRNRVNGKENRMKLFVDNMLTDEYVASHKNEEYDSMINCIGGYEFERVFQPINYILDSLISIRMYDDEKFREKIKEIRHCDCEDKYKYIVNMTNHSKYPVFLGIYLKYLFLKFEIKKYDYMDFYKNAEKCKPYEYKFENTDANNDEQSRILEGSKTDFYKLEVIENNYFETMVSEKFKYADTDKYLMMPIRVKEEYIEVYGDKYKCLKKTGDVNIEWINECLHLGTEFKEMVNCVLAYLSKICTMEDIMKWCSDIVEGVINDNGINKNKLSKHLNDIWNNVYQYAKHDPKLAMTKVHNEYFEKYFSSVENERREKKRNSSTSE